MNPEQALQILTNLSNLTVANGGIYASIDEAATVRTALTVMATSVQSATNLEEELLSVRATDETNKTQITQLQTEVAELKAKLAEPAI